jgi:NAD(P)-dependent dehydrogenase (short-subunit alcohol dehydrogenase family)
MAKTVLITGASSGIGKAAVKVFAEAGWQVAATSRHPKVEDFADMDHVHCYALDVTKPDTIKKAFVAAQQDFGQLNVVVNNAGYGVDGIFEAMDDETIQQQFDTNVFGLMRVTREAIHAMRQSGGGTIIQISSAAGRITYPLSSLYHATKWSVEGFTESLQYELRPLGIRLKLIEPGAIKTEFYGRSGVFIRPAAGIGYDAILAHAEPVTQGAVARGEDPIVVAREILRAANDTSGKLRFPVGKPAPSLTRLRKLSPDWLFFFLMRRAYKVPKSSHSS